MRWWHGIRVGDRRAECSGGKTVLNRKIQLAFGAPILVLLVAGAISYRGILASSESNRWVRHTHEVLENLQNLVSGVESIESSSRERS